MEEKQAGRSVEKERQVKEIFESLLVGLQAENAERQEDSEAWLEDRLASLPAHAQEDIRNTDRDLRSENTSAALRTKLAEKAIVAAEQTYQDLRFTVGEGEHMLNKAYAKEQGVMHLKEILGNSPTLEDMKRVALLSFDANGLKAVNDLSGVHENGTEYLRRIAEVFHAKDSAEAKRLKELGIDEILPVMAGGDEYAVLLKSEKPIPPEAVEEALRMYDEAIQRLDVSDLVDFKDEGTLLRYLGYSNEKAATLSPAERQAALESVRAEMPPGFTMRASASGGGGTLYDGLIAALEHPTKPIKAGENFNESVAKINGGMWDAADRSATQNKLAYKESLRDPEASAAEKFYSKVLARTTEARVLEAKLDAMSLELKKGATMESEQAELDKLLDDGVIDDAAYGKAMREIRKKYRTQA